MKPRTIFGGNQPLPSGGITILLVATWAALCLWASRVEAQFGGQGIPTATYHGTFYTFYDGDYKDALDLFKSELRGGIKTAQSRWIDSICYNTMVAECYYHTGNLDKALEHYTAALTLYLAFPDWMMRVQFPPAIRPAQAHAQRIPWGVSARQVRLGHYSTTMLMSQGRINNNAAVRGGGAIQQAQLFPINVQEIVRCTTLALRRRTELLGPLSKYDPLSDSLLAALSRAGPPNHWSQAWVDVQLGLAMVAAGREVQALPVLQRSVVAAGEYDHPLTSTALLELGRLALLRGDFANASQFFHEATVAAVHYFDAGILEDAFRYGAITHLVANRPGLFPALEPAARWAKVKDYRQLRASLLISAAENLLVLGQTPQAATMLDGADTAIARRTMRSGRIGARLNYVSATALFQERKIAAGDKALGAAMSYMLHGGYWLYQIRYLDNLFTRGQVTATQGPITFRTAKDIYAELLGDPQPVDWRLRPMESLAVLRTPHSESFEHWFLIALERKSPEDALEIADRARRHRFFSSLAYGGRLQSLRWVLEAPDDMLPQQARLNRQDLLAQYPAYAGLAQQAQQVRAAMDAAPLVPEAPEAVNQLRGQLTGLGTISVGQEAILREIAVRREPAAMVFPPFRTTLEIQQALPDGNVLLAFFAAKGDLYGFLMDQKNYRAWRIRGTPTLVNRIAGLLRAMGHFEANRELSLKDLEDPKWKEAARQVLAHILEGSPADFTAEFPELVVVPDGILWYVPFESLLVDIQGQMRPLISRFRLRYAPTASLAVPTGRGRNPTAETAVVVGRLDPRHDDSVAQEAFSDLARAVPRCTALPKPPLPGPAALYTSLMDQLIVLDDINLEDHGPYTWAPVPIDKGKPGNALGDWLALPWQGPDVVILPGYHTAAENALKRVNPAAPGGEVFLSVCGLMSSGARTVLMSRWRSGGQTSFDIVREFAQELPHTSPADAWQRAVLVVTDSRLDLDAEPRLKRVAAADPPKATHPFFWSGYMLLDSGTLPEQEEPEPERPAVKLQDPRKRELKKAPDPEQPKPEAKKP